MFAGGSDNTSSEPDKGFKPKFQAAPHPLRNANGVTVKTFWQLDPEVRSTIRTFLVTGVSRKDQGAAWSVVAPSVKAGYTYKSWKNANALPIIFYPVGDIHRVQYYLDYASDQEILLEVGLLAPKRYKMHAATFQLGLVPIGKGGHKQWLVDYFMPRWTPPLPSQQ